jgi:SEC-C motif-containing protein
MAPDRTQVASGKASLRYPIDLRELYSPDDRRLGVVCGRAVLPSNLMPVEAPCPCGSLIDYETCCAPVLRNASAATTAEALMRSRYTAFELQHASHLLATWHPDTRPSRISFDPLQRWLGLKILRTDRGGPADDDGVVEFVARFKVAGRATRLREVSRFVRLSGQWFYVDGDHLQ